MPSASRAPRGSLSRDRVRDAALALADESGVAAVTIRSIAARLGAKPMAVYHHVGSKDEILDAIVDCVYAQMYLPSPAGPWRDELAERSRSMRAVLARHPWAVGLMETRRHPGPATLASHEALLDVLRTAGFSLAATAHAGALLDAYVFGFALQEVMLQAVALEADPQALIDGMDLTAAPRMREFAEEYVMRSGYAFGDSFEVGLRLVLDGVTVLHDAPTP